MLELEFEHGFISKVWDIFYYITDKLTEMNKLGKSHYYLYYM